MRPAGRQELVIVHWLLICVCCLSILVLLACQLCKWCVCGWTDSKGMGIDEEGEIHVPIMTMDPVHVSGKDGGDEGSKQAKVASQRLV